MTDIKWLSVWCRAFSVNFGDLIFPDNLDVSSKEESVAEPTSEPEPETNPEPEAPYVEKPKELPPPVLSPVDNDLSNVHNTPRHGHDADAYPEAESEPETEAETTHYTEPYSGANVPIITSTTAILIAVVSWIVL